MPVVYMDSTNQPKELKPPKAPKITVEERNAKAKQRLLDKGHTEEQIAAGEEQKAAFVKAFMNAKRQKV